MLYTHTTPPLYYHLTVVVFNQFIYLLRQNNIKINNTYCQLFLRSCPSCTTAPAPLVSVSALELSAYEVRGMRNDRAQPAFTSSLAERSARIIIKKKITVSSVPLSAALIHISVIERASGVFVILSPAISPREPVGRTRVRHFDRVCATERPRERVRVRVFVCVCACVCLCVSVYV